MDAVLVYVPENVIPWDRFVSTRKVADETRKQVKWTKKQKMRQKEKISVNSTIFWLVKSKKRMLTTQTMVVGNMTHE